MATVIVVGAGINGVTSAIELKKRRATKLSWLTPGPCPIPWLLRPTSAKRSARLTVRTKIIPRSRTGALNFGESGMPKFGIELYQKRASCLFASTRCSLAILNMKAAGPGKTGTSIRTIRFVHVPSTFPAFAEDRFQDGFFDPDAGYWKRARRCNSQRSHLEIDPPQTRGKR